MLALIESPRTRGGVSCARPNQVSPHREITENKLRELKALGLSSEMNAAVFPGNTSSLFTLERCVSA